MNQVSELQREAGTAKKTKVTVTATPLSSSPWVGFAMTSDYVDKGGKQDGSDKLKFDANAGDFDLSFKLEDQTGLNLAFYPDFADAMWVAVGTNCPTGPGDGNGAITPGAVTSSKLTVNNANSVAQTLTFALRFTGAGSDSGHPPYVYDPQIINGGGSNSF